MTCSWCAWCLSSLMCLTCFKLDVLKCSMSTGLTRLMYVMPRALDDCHWCHQCSWYLLCCMGSKISGINSTVLLMGVLDVPKPDRYQILPDPNRESEFPEKFFRHFKSKFRVICYIVCLSLSHPDTSTQFMITVPTCVTEERILDISPEEWDCRILHFPEKLKQCREKTEEIFEWRNELIRIVCR